MPIQVYRYNLYVRPPSPKEGIVTRGSGAPSVNFSKNCMCERHLEYIVTILDSVSVNGKKQIRS